MAPMRPGAPSEMTTIGEPRPRARRSARKSAKASADSPAAAARPTNTGAPAVSMPQAAGTGSARAPSCMRKWAASR